MNARSKAHVLVAYATAAICLIVGLTGSAYAVGSSQRAALVNNQVLCPEGVSLEVRPDGTWRCLTPATPGPSASASATASPTPSASPTVSPTPAPTTPPSGACMPVPSACGFPDATNTGPTSTGLTVVNGSVTLSTPGQVYANRDVRGCVRVTAKGVTIRNVKITCGGYYAISVNTGSSSNPWNAADAALTVEDTEINMAGQLNGKAIAFDGYTLRRVHVYGGSDCAHAGVNVRVLDSFCDIPAGGPNDGPHYDGVQSDGGRNIEIRHNTIRVPYAQTAAILMSTNTSPIRDVTIVDNLVAGGGYAIYCGTDAGGPVLGSFTFTGNVIARTYFSRGGYWGPILAWGSKVVAGYRIVLTVHSGQSGHNETAPGIRLECPGRRLHRTLPASRTVRSDRARRSPCGDASPCSPRPADRSRR